MIDIERAVFSAAVDAFLANYPAGAYYDQPVETPAAFPSMELAEVDNSTYDKSLDAEMREHHAKLLYQLDVYSNLSDGAKDQCRAIVALIDPVMLSLGFVRKMCRLTRNQDERITRMTARYQGIVSEDYRIYRR